MEHFENVVVDNGNVRESDILTLFGPNARVHFTKCTTMQALMKEMGVFPSTSEATRAGRVGPIPRGFTDDFKASKKRRLWIWNPDTP
jgi:hypothetical protein